MYCINCGVKLADSEKQCPLCGVVPFHPDIDRPEGESMYPNDKYPVQKFSRLGGLIVVTTFFLLPLIITLLCDISMTHAVTWSGFVAGALLMAYVIVVLPFWFKKPNPVIYIPCDFVAIGLYLLYINYALDGNWFLSFALPVVGVIGLLVTTVIALLKYVRRGELYILGGAFIALGFFMLLLEYLINNTFIHHFTGWSLYPLVALILLGGMLIFLALCRPARETMERKFFI